jgi:enamine deaminase RidA (YjgF/YER057c/UK114 family)
MKRRTEGSEMSDHLEPVETADADPKWNMPYSAAIKVHSGKTVWISGVTAAPIYHSHPHRPEEFDDIPADPGEQARLAFEHLGTIVQAAGGTLEDLVQLNRYLVDLDRNQDAINAAQKQFVTSMPTTTTVEVVRLATDPRLVLELTAVAVVPD